MPVNSVQTPLGANTLEASVTSVQVPFVTFAHVAFVPFVSLIQISVVQLVQTAVVTKTLSEDVIGIDASSAVTEPAMR